MAAAGNWNKPTQKVCCGRSWELLTTHTLIEIATTQNNIVAGDMHSSTDCLAFICIYCFVSSVYACLSAARSVILVAFCRSDIKVNDSSWCLALIWILWKAEARSVYLELLTWNASSWTSETDASHVQLKPRAGFKRCFSRWMPTFSGIELHQLFVWEKDLHDVLRNHHAEVWSRPARARRYRFKMAAQKLCRLGFSYSFSYWGTQLCVWLDSKLNLGVTSRSHVHVISLKTSWVSSFKLSLTLEKFRFRVKWTTNYGQL